MFVLKGQYVSKEPSDCSDRECASCPSGKTSKGDNQRASDCYSVASSTSTSETTTTKTTTTTIASTTNATTTTVTTTPTTTLAPNDDDDDDDNNSGECSANTTLGVAKGHMASVLTKALDGDIRNINDLLEAVLDEADVAISRVVKKKTIVQDWDAGCVRESVLGCLCNPRGTVTGQITKIEGISSLRVTDFRNIRIDKQ